MLLEQAALSLKEGHPKSLEQSRLNLKLSDFLCRVWDTSDSVQLLRDIE